MSLRRTALVVSLLVLPLVLGATTAPAARGPAAKGPTNLRITASSPTSVSLAWDAGTSKSSNWWYCVQRDGQGCFRVDPPKTTWTFPNLWPGTTFNWSVVALDANGNRSAPSNTVTFTTPPDTTPPSAPTLSEKGVWPTRIAVDWTRSTDNSTQVFYTLLVDGSPYPAGQINFQSALLIRLAPESTHTFKVVVRDFFGNSAESNTIDVTTPPVTERNPPTVPQNLRLSLESSIPEIWLDWDASTDDTDPQALIMYEVFINGVLDQLGTTIGAPETVTYCQGSGTNTIMIRAVDTSGNASAFGNQIVFC